MSNNKSNLEYEKYIEMKDRMFNANFMDRFKNLNKALYWFSWFGNGTSIFLAYFFLVALISNGFTTNIGISIGVVVFLAMFELLKRYVFGLFSVEFLKNSKKLNKKMTPFILGVIVLVFGSFYFTMNGANDFINKEDTFKAKTEVNIQAKVDSLNNYYFNQYIKPIMDENKLLINQNSTYASMGGQPTVRAKYVQLMETNTNKIESNNTLIQKYETKRDGEIDKFTNTQNSKLDKSLSDNSSNTIAFILLSFLIETIIIIGVYFDKVYDFRVITDYESSVINTPEFKKWQKYDLILSMIFTKAKDVGDQIPTTSNMVELLALNGMNINNVELDKVIKTFYFLEILKLEGKRRVLNVVEESGKKSLKNYFGIK